MNKHKILLALTISILLIRCSPAIQTPGNLSSPEQNTVASPSITPTKIVPTSSPDPSDIEECVELKLSNANVSILDGFLVLREGIDGYFFLDLKTLKILNIGQENERIYRYILSPNKKFLIADACNGDICYYILRTVDNVIKTIPSRSDWVLWRWLDDGRIIILSLREPHDVVVLNPFTGEETSLKLDLPDPHIYQRTDTESLIPASVDLSLKRVVYYDQKNGGRLILRNLETQMEMVSVPYTVDQSAGYELVVGWSPDGEKLITVSPNSGMSMPNELFELDMDGRLVQLSSYNQKYEFANISYPMWSPNNHNIAFWLKIGDETNSSQEHLSQYLTVIDTNSLATQIYCLKFSVSSYPATSVAWSPNGDQLITNTRLANGVVESVLVDLTHGTQLVISETSQMWVEDWMAP